VNFLKFLKFLKRDFEGLGFSDRLGILSVLGFSDWCRTEEGEAIDET
jgi:hypothetical protein